MTSRPWHDFPRPAPGSTLALAAAVLLGIVFAMGTFLYLVAWDLASLPDLCELDPERTEPCPRLPPQETPSTTLTAVRWVLWSACLLMIATAVVLAQLARGGNGTVRRAWVANAGAAVAGLAFSVLALYGPIGDPA